MLKVSLTWNLGFPIACEGDVDGSLGCLIAKLLGCGAVYLSDWLEHDEKTLTLWHGGMAPFQVLYVILVEIALSLYVSVHQS